MAESVRVIVRSRPLNQRELSIKSKVCVEIEQSLGQCILLNGSENGPPKVFSFDAVYHMESATEQIYNEIVFPLVENVVEGYNGTVFAYGQTGSGKTFSMQGITDSGPQKGVIPRTFEHIFESISTISNTKFLVHISYLEIYNEEIRDLLGMDKEKKLEIKEHPEQGVYVASLSMHICHNSFDCAHLMNEGFQNRHVGATLMNKDSSRSHSIFTIYVEALCENGSIRTGKLHLVDLAGSERQSKTGATGDRFKEATKINLSLSALGNVISALVDGKSSHIPYRDSKLTRLLQDSLGGNTKTVMIACISPSDNNFEETLSTLRYANRAKNIKNKPRINEDPKDALLREYKEEIERLKALVQQTGGDEIEIEKEKLKQEYEKALEELRSSYESEQKNKESLQIDLQKLKEQYERANDELENIRKSEALSLDPNEAKKRIEMLEHQLVGGEQANNETLKQKRKKRIRDAEKKMQRLAEAMNVNKDNPLLKVYASTQEQLDDVTKQYNLEKQNVVALETEIRDLTSEFETDRLDYLETIRKQEQQIKLLEQILDKIQPTIHKEINYSNIAKIKKDAIWNEDSGCWNLPDLGESRNGLPNTSLNSKTPHFELGNDYDEMHLFANEQEGASRLKKKLDQSMDNDFVKNYFKRITKKSNILEKYNTDKHKAFIEERIKNFKKHAQKVDSLIKGVVMVEPADDQPGLEYRSNWWNTGIVNKRNSLLNGVQNSSANRPNSGTVKKPPPQRLEALNAIPTVTRNKSFTN